MHSRKILSQAGTSLADVYDVEGSVVGLEELDVTNIQGVHELGGQIQSERLTAINFIAQTAVIGQSTAWDIVFTGFSDAVHRLLSLVVLSDVAARVDFCSVSIRDDQTLGEQPIWVWHNANDVESEIRWASPTVVARFALRPTSQLPGGVPTLLARTGISRAMPSLTFRGQSLAFGAGTFQAQALFQVVRANNVIPSAGEPSSHGLPIPSW